MNVRWFYRITGKGNSHLKNWKPKLPGIYKEVAQVAKTTINIKTLIEPNEAHMRYVQESRCSNEYGFHGPSKKQKRRKERRQIKQAMKSLLY